MFQAKTFLLLITLGLVLSACGGAAEDSGVAAPSASVQLPNEEPNGQRPDDADLKYVAIPRGKLAQLSFDAVAGAEEAKKALLEFVDVVRNPERDQHLGVRPPRGILLVGPPGVGKTMLARATASAVDLNFFSFTGVDLYYGGLGRSGSDFIHEIFAEARKNAPALIFIDEIDMLSMGGGAMAKQLGAEMDGAQGGGEVYVIAAANSIQFLPSSLLRANRFDRIVTVAEPDKATRAQILRMQTANTQQAADVDLDYVAYLADGLSGADLTNLVNVAGLRAASAHRSAVAAVDWEEALDDVRLGPVSNTQEKSARALKRTAAHEAGHAIVAELMDDHPSVHRVTVVGRGPASGHTSYLPLEEAPVGDLHFWQSRVAVALAGQAAEALVLNSFGPGASVDLRTATEQARTAILNYGMDDELGPVDMGVVDSPSTETRSEALHAAVDAATQKFIKTQAQRASSLLTEHREALDRVVEALLRCQTLRGAEVRQLMSGEPLVGCSLAAG